jgi:hypothetical protein
MNKLICAVLASATILGCGGGSDETFTLASGQYTLSNITFSKDTCQINSGFAAGHEITVTVTGTNATVAMVSQEGTPSTGAISGDSFTASASRTSDTIPGTNCNDSWTKTVTGTLTANGTFTGSYKWTDQTIGGTDCSNADAIGFTPPSCESDFTFTATKKPGT